MGDAAGELAEAFHLLSLRELGLHAAAIGDVADAGEIGRLTVPFHRHHAHLGLARLGALDHLDRRGLALADRAAQELRHQLGAILAQKLAGGFVDVAHMTLDTGHHHGVRIGGQHALDLTIGLLRPEPLQGIQETAGEKPAGRFVLADKILGAFGKRGLARARPIRARQHHDRDIRVDGPNLVESVDTARIRQVQIEDDRVDGLCLKNSKRFLEAPHHHQSVAVTWHLGEELGGQLGVGRIVLDQEENGLVGAVRPDAFGRPYGGRADGIIEVSTKLLRRHRFGLRAMTGHASGSAGVPSRTRSC